MSDRASTTERASGARQRSVRVERAVRIKRTSERCERMSKRMSEWPSTSVCIHSDGCEFYATSLEGGSSLKIKSNKEGK